MHMRRANVRAAENNRATVRPPQSAVSAETRSVDLGDTYAVHELNFSAFGCSFPGLVHSRHLDDHSFEYAGGQDPAHHESHRERRSPPRSGAWGAEFQARRAITSATACGSARFFAPCSMRLRHPGTREALAEVGSRMPEVNFALRVQMSVANEPVPPERPGCRGAFIS